ncbi:MAG: hypothetical protein ACREBR_03445 [bacterium]
MALVPGAAPPTYTTYGEWYADPRVDSFRGTYGRVCGLFRPAVDADNVPVDDAQTLLDQILVNDKEPHAFIMMVQGPRGPYSILLHRLIKIRNSFGHIPTPLEGRTFAMVGEIRDVDLTTVEWPNDALGTTPEVVVPNVAELEQQLAAHPGEVVLGPYGANANYETIRTRRAMYVPSKYVPLVLHGVLSPRALWERMGRAIIADGNEITCNTLLDWLRAALVRPAAAPASTVVTIMRHPQPIAGEHPPLSEQRAARVREDLPQRFPTPQGALEGTLAQAMGAMRRDMIGEREDNRREKESVKLPSKRWKTTLHILMRVCHVQNELHLPQLWHDLAEGSTKEDRRIFQAHLDTRAGEDDAATSVEPVATPELTTKLVAFRFSARDSEDLGDGITPFSTLYRSHASAAGQHQRAHDYDTVMQGTSGVTFSDIEKFKKNSRTSSSLPSSLFQAFTSAAIYATVLETALGIRHPLCKSYRIFLREWQRNGPRLEYECNRDLLYPSKLLREVQVELVEWFRKQEKTEEEIVVPRLNVMFEEIRRGKWVHPSMPFQIGERQMTPEWISTAPPQHTQNPPGGPPMAPPHSEISLLTGDTARPKRPPTGAQSNRSSSFVRNTTPKAELQVSNAFRLKPVTDEHAPPPNSTGDPMCVSYHCKGSCYANCNRASDHRLHTKAEDDALLSWKATYLDKVAKTSAPAS